MALTEQRCVTTLRLLAVDMVEAANSGHPGLPLGAAPMAYALWSDGFRHNPANPGWFNRDRFVLSAGHGSALLYGLLYLFGYGLDLEDLRNFRKLHSKTPGHPEFRHTLGVEATTGPLGQGFAMGVGMAWAQQRLASELPAKFVDLADHYVYAIVSDGDLMEGLTSEAASLAGHLGLGRLIYLYDDNRISIEGSTDLAFTEDVGQRFQAYGWQVLTVADGEDLGEIRAALAEARTEADRPSLIKVRTQIGYGSPMAGSAHCHGAPLGKAMAETKRFYDWPEEPFHVPVDVEGYFRVLGLGGTESEGQWRARMAEFRQADPAAYQRWHDRIHGHLPSGWDTELNALDFGAKPIATRSASGKALNAIANHLPALVGGSADLAPSNNTDILSDPSRVIHFGVREHAMAAMVNGMALHGGFFPYCGTFLVFSDYMRPAIRLAAMMQTHVIFVLTHDSIAVGEDGPTHQPIEHLASLRAIPHLLVIRPADAYETAQAWRLAIALESPVCLILTRQNLPVLPKEKVQVQRGGYVLADCEGLPHLILLASGSEVHLALAAKPILEGEGIPTRVVSLPSWELFDSQPVEYRREVLPPEVGRRIAIEAGSEMGWHRYVGDHGEVIGLSTFGASGPGPQVMAHFGFTVEHVVQRARMRVHHHHHHHR